MKKYTQYIWLLLILVFGLTAILMTRPSSKLKTIQFSDSPIGFSEPFALEVNVFEPPIKIIGRLISDNVKLDWADALFVLRYPQGLTFDDFKNKVSPEYISVNNVSLDAFNEIALLPRDKIPNLDSVFYYSLHVLFGGSEYLVVVGANFTQASKLPPSDQLTAGTFKKISGEWRAYPIEANPVLSILPWNDLLQMQRIWSAGKTKVGGYGNLVPDSQ